MQKIDVLEIKLRKVVGKKFLMKIKKNKMKEMVF